MARTIGIGQQDFADAFAAGMAFDELTDGGMN